MTATVELLYARIGAAGTGEVGSLSRNLLYRFLDRGLDRTAVLLELPAGIVSPVVLYSEFYVSHLPVTSLYLCGEIAG